MRWRVVVVVVVAVTAAAVGWAAPARAHKPSGSYLTLRIGQEGRWDLALRDLDLALGIDVDGNGRITWGEVRSRQAAIAEYALARLTVSRGGEPCPLHAAAQGLVRHSDGVYLALRLDAACAAASGPLAIDYGVFFAVDPGHRGLVQVVGGDERHALVFRAGDRRQTVTLGAARAGRQFLAFLREGVRHIWNGVDHLCFLFALLLPAVLRREGGRWRPVRDLRAAAGEVVRVVTAFTVAHSITLALAATAVLRLPARFVETAIAASIVVAALNNLVPRVEARWSLAFTLGLLHGFGFSSVLVDLGLPPTSLLSSLVGFNLGVELGQLAIVATFLPLAFVMRATWIYRRLVLVGGSLAIAVAGTLWAAQRLGL